MRGIVASYRRRAVRSTTLSVAENCRPWHFGSNFNPGVVMTTPLERVSKLPKDRELPIAMIGASVVLFFLIGLIKIGFGLTLKVLIVQLILSAIIAVAVVAATILLADTLKLSLGDRNTAALKVAAAAIASALVVSALALLISLFAGIVGTIIAAVLFFLAVSFLFSLPPDKAGILTAVYFVVAWLVTWLLAPILTRMIIA
jgi:hypothetical protein